MPERTFFLKSRPPLRAFLLAALLSLVGGVLTVLSLQHGWNALAVAFFIIVLVLGIALFTIAIMATMRLGVRITITDDGYKVSGTQVTREGQWKDVSKVTQAVEGAHITIYHGDVRRTHLIFPGGPAQAQMQDVIDEIMARLERVKQG
uniref:hypothetical protein n=1 Tax=Tessaracoccus timonensis TaxID=2161816 RepID=UPI000D5506A8|nr:hypothetical protein [Tessaracoccus timonensis]